MDRLFLIAAAVLFSTGGVLIKWNTLTPWQVASFRSAIAGGILFFLLPSARKALSWKLIPTGVAYAATLVLFVLANKKTTSANAIFLQSTAPLYLIFIGPLMLRERLRRADLLFIAAVAVGMAVFFLAEEQAWATAPDPVTGNWIAALSGVAWALTIAGLRWAGRTSSESSIGGAAVIVGNIFACLIALPFAFPVNSFSVTDAAVLLYLGIFQIAAAYLCLVRGLRGVPALEASAVLLVEPVLNPVWTWLALGERPGALAMGGGAVILAATLANTWWQNRAALEQRA